MPAERFCLCVEMATESSPLQIRPEVVSKLKRFDSHFGTTRIVPG